MRREEKRRRIIQKDLKRVSRNITQRALLLKSGFLQSLMRNCSQETPAKALCACGCCCVVCGCSLCWLFLCEDSSPAKKARKPRKWDWG